MTLKSKGSKETARDISWHPHFPIIASTSFSGEVNLWSLQNEEEEEGNKVVEKQELNDEEDEVSRRSGGMFTRETLIRLLMSGRFRNDSSDEEEQ